MLTTRRFFLLSGTFFFQAKIFGEQVRTPWQGEGPFYPENIPEDSDNDLLKNGDSKIDADGKILNISGILVDVFNKPLKEVLVEIWQTDSNGIYLHSSSFGAKSRDKKFQGFGKAITDKKGQFFFRTIIPSGYPGRTPHIHLRLLRNNSNILTTQLYFHGNPLNEKDFLFRSLNLNEKRLNSLKLAPKIKKNVIEYNTSVILIV